MRGRSNELAQYLGRVAREEKRRLSLGNGMAAILMEGCPVLIGYARTSTIDQVAGFEAQIEQLKKSGCEKIFSEQISARAERLELERALEFVREGDIFVVTKLDRLARSMRDLVRIVERLQAKNVSLRILDMNLDTSTPTGMLMLNVLGAVAEFERAIMLERQREGIARARASGKFKGKPAKVPKLMPEILRLHNDGIAAAEIARRLRLGRVTVYRALRSSKVDHSSTS